MAAELEGKLALVSGGSRAIGAVCARWSGAWSAREPLQNPLVMLEIERG